MSDDVEEVHDFSLLEAEDKRRSKSNTARAIVSSGIAALLAGAGVGLAAFGISFVIQPKIIETTKVVTETKIERVETEKPIVTEKVVTVDRPVVTEKMVQAPAAPLQPLPAAKPQQTTPPPEPGQQMSKGEFQNTAMFRDAAKCKGVLVSHIRGVMKFQNGSECYDAHEDGSRDDRLTTTRHDGDMTTCNETGRSFPNGRPEWRCYALHKGMVEDMSYNRASRVKQHDSPSDDPFSELFQ